MPPCDCGVHSHNSRPFSRYRVPREVTSRFVGFVFGAGPDFPKSYKKSATLAKKNKFPEICHKLQLIRWISEISE
eukprot:6789281-Prymnesium_polylepis.1